MIFDLRPHEAEAWERLRTRLPSDAQELWRDDLDLVRGAIRRLQTPVQLLLIMAPLACFATRFFATETVANLTLWGAGAALTALLLGFYSWPPLRRVRNMAETVHSLIGHRKARRTLP